VHSHKRPGAELHVPHLLWFAQSTCALIAVNGSKFDSESLHHSTIHGVIHNHEGFQQCHIVDKRFWAIVRQHLSKEFQMIGRQLTLMFREHAVDTLQNFLKIICQDAAFALVIEVEASSPDGHTVPEQKGREVLHQGLFDVLCTILRDLECLQELIIVDRATPCDVNGIGQLQQPCLCEGHTLDDEL